MNDDDANKKRTTVIHYVDTEDDVVIASPHRHTVALSFGLSTDQ